MVRVRLAINFAQDKNFLEVKENGMSRNLLVLFTLFVTGCSGADTVSCVESGRKLSAMFNGPLWREEICPKALSAKGERVAQSGGAINGPYVREIIDLCRSVRKCEMSSRGTNPIEGILGVFRRIFTRIPSCDDDRAVDAVRKFILRRGYETAAAPTSTLVDYVDESIGRVGCVGSFPATWPMFNLNPNYNVQVSYFVQYDLNGSLIVGGMVEK